MSEPGLISMLRIHRGCSMAPERTCIGRRGCQSSTSSQTRTGSWKPTIMSGTPIHHIDPSGASTGSRVTTSSTRTPGPAAVGSPIGAPASAHDTSVCRS